MGHTGESEQDETNKGVRRKTRKVKHDNFVRNSMRRKCSELYFKIQPPTLNGIMTASNIDPELPHFKNFTLHV